VFSVSPPRGVLSPDPRWSKQRIRNRAASKNRCMCGEVPAPGPPCKQMTGNPSGFP